MAIAYVQASTFSFTGTSGTGSLTGVSAGSCVVVLVSKTDTTIETISVSDDVDGSYELGATNDANSGRQTQANYLTGHTGGNIVVTVDSSGGGGMVIEGCVVEFSVVAPTSPVDDSDSFDTTSNSTTMYAAPTTGFNVTSGSVIVAAFTTNADGGTLSVVGSYTLLASSSRHLHMYRIAGSDLTNERPEISLTTARQGPAVCLALLEGAAVTGRRRIKAVKAQGVTA